MKIHICKDNKVFPFLYIDNWYSPEEEKLIWRELDFYTIRSIVEKICTSMNVNFNDYIKVGKTRIGLDHSYFMKSQKSKQKLNWSPKISLNSGLLKTIAYFDKNINLINKKPSHYIHKK